MPLYEYKCTKCETRFELIQKFSAPLEAECTECGAKSERLLSAPAIQFKGSGWYVTDYADKAAPSTDKADKPGESATGGDETSKESTKGDIKDGKKAAVKDSTAEVSKPAKKEKSKSASSSVPK